MLNTCNFHLRFRLFFSLILSENAPNVDFREAKFQIFLREHTPRPPTVRAPSALQPILAGPTLNCFRRACPLCLFQCLLPFPPLCQLEFVPVCQWHLQGCSSFITYHFLTVSSQISRFSSKSMQSLFVTCIIIVWLLLTNASHVYKIIYSQPASQPVNQSKNQVWNWLFHLCSSLLVQIDHRKPATISVAAHSQQLSLMISKKKTSYRFHCTKRGTNHTKQSVIGKKPNICLCLGPRHT